MAIIDVVSWQSPEYDDQTYAWRFPSNELSTWTQLLVNESQEAVLYRSGAVDGPFGPGRHVLKTENLPILKNVLNLPFGRSPFTAEVWYVNKAIPLNVKWGTAEPILLKDPEYKIMIPVVARGQYGVQIENSRKFLIKLVGAMPDFKQDKLQDYFKGLILTTAKSVIAKEIVKKQVPILEIAAELVDLSDSIKAALQESLDEFGLKLVSFFVDAIDVKEDDESIRRLRESLAKKADMGILGYTYQQDRSFNTLEGAAGYTAAQGNTINGLQNEGGGIPQAAMGIGLGIGAAIPMGQVMGQQVAQGVTPLFNTGKPCVKCASPISPNAKFCVNCGTPAEVATAAVCPACGTNHPENAAFCPQCATPLKKSCGGCGAKLGSNARFCTECGMLTSNQTA